jgi:hypothetical protein
MSSDCAAPAKARGALLIPAPDLVPPGRKRLRVPQQARRRADGRRSRIVPGHEASAASDQPPRNLLHLAQRSFVERILKPSWRPAGLPDRHRAGRGYAPTGPGSAVRPPGEVPAGAALTARPSRALRGGPTAGLVGQAAPLGWSGGRPGVVGDRLRSPGAAGHLNRLSWRPAAALTVIPAAEPSARRQG